MRFLSIPLLCVTFVASPAVAIDRDEDPIPGAPRLLPKDTLAYIRVGDADELREVMSTTSIGRMLADPQLRPLVDDVYLTATDLFAEIGDQVGIDLPTLLAIPHGQVVAAAMPARLSDEQAATIDDGPKDESEEAIRARIEQKRRRQNAIAGWFMVDAGDRIDDLMNLIETLEGGLEESGYVRRTREVETIRLVRWLPPREGRPPVEYFRDRGVVVLGIGHQTAGESLKHWVGRGTEKTLADNVDFGTIMSRCLGAESTRPQITYFVDPYHLIGRFVRRGGAGAFVWPIVQELGLGKFRGIGGSTFRGEGVFEDVSHMHVLIDPPRNGFLGLLQPESGDVMPPAWVPAEITSYTTLHWDFGEMVEELDKVIGKFSGEGPIRKQVEPGIKNFTGVSLLDEFLPQLTGRMISLRKLEKPVAIDSQAQVISFAIEDSVAMTNLLETMRQKVSFMNSDTIAGQTIYTVPGNRPGRETPSGVRPKQPTIWVMGEWLLYADSRKFAELVLRSQAGSVPSLAGSLDFQVVAGELGGKLDGEDPFALSFLRQSDSIRQFYDLLASDTAKGFIKRRAEGNPRLGKIAEMLERNAFPDFEEFEKYFPPAGWFAYNEPGGIHLASFTIRVDE